MPSTIQCSLASRCTWSVFPNRWSAWGGRTSTSIVARTSAPSRALAGLTFAVALLGTVGCNAVAAPVQDPAPPIDVVAGQEFNGTVDTFTDSDPTASAFGAQVLWGDPEGNVSLGSVTP